MFFKDKTMSNNYGVIFDMDGVLADTGPIHYESWVKMANEIGKTFKKSFFEATFGQQSVHITRKLVGRKVDQNLVEKWAQLKEQYYREMVKDKIEPLPGVIELIEDLKSTNFKLAVGSSGPPENVELLLKSLKIKLFFDVIITAADVQNGKPSPDVFIIAAQKINVKPQNCLVIEDAPVGIEAAKRANMKCIALTTTHDVIELRTADMIVQDLSFISVKDIHDLLNIKTQ
jgi:beta-phosphoglucomutase family hydrolase